MGLRCGGKRRTLRLSIGSQTRCGQCCTIRQAPLSDLCAAAVASGEVILTSEMYEAKSSAEHGIECVQRDCQDDSCFEHRTSSAGDPYFVLKAPNGEVIGKSEMYSSQSALQNGIDSVKRNAVGANTSDLTG